MTVLVLSMSERHRADVFEIFNEVEDVVAVAVEEMAKTYDDPRMLTVSELTADDIHRVLTENNLDKKITRICSFNEYSVLPAAELRGKLAIDGQTVGDAIRYRDKYIMKQHVQNALSFKIPRFADQSSYPGLISDPEINKIVVKPRLKGGSIDLRVYEREHFPENIEADEIAEGYLDFPLIHVDGVIKKGKLAFFSISEYENNCLSFYDKQYLASKNHGHNHDKDQIESILKEILELIPSQESFAFHLELFYGKGSYYFCEIACRPGGSYLVKAIKESYGVDINQASLLLQAGFDVDIPPARQGKFTSFFLFPHGYTKHVDTEFIAGLGSMIRYDITEKKDSSEHSADPHIGVFLANEDRQRLLADEAKLLNALNQQL